MELREFTVDAPAFGLDDIAGREFYKKIFRGCENPQELLEILGISSAYGFLVSGKAGTGKTMLLEAFAGELARKGYGYVPIKKELPLEEVLNACAHGEPCFVLLEDLDVFLEGQDREEALLSWLTGIYEKDLPVIFAATAREEEKVPEKLRRELLPVRLADPDEEERKELFERSLGELFYMKKGFGPEEMAKETQGMSFGELNTLVIFVKALMKDRALYIYQGDLERAVLELENKVVLLSEDIFMDALSHVVPQKEEPPEKEEPSEPVHEKEEKSPAGANGDLAAAMMACVAMMAKMAQGTSSSPVKTEVCENQKEVPLEEKKPEIIPPRKDTDPERVVSPMSLFGKNSPMRPKGL